VLWKDLNAALFCGVRGELCIPNVQAAGQARAQATAHRP
jgi:hypothetical protein